MLFACLQAKGLPTLLNNLLHQFRFSRANLHQKTVVKELIESSLIRLTERQLEAICLREDKPSK